MASEDPAAMYSPQSQKLTVGARLNTYTQNVSTPIKAAIKPLIFRSKSDGRATMVIFCPFMNGVVGLIDQRRSCTVRSPVAAGFQTRG
jgi:hypothetical protein